jgi:hypothetical protein
VSSLVQACSGAGGESSSNGTDPSLMLMPNCRTRRGPRRGKAPRRGPYPAGGWENAWKAWRLFLGAPTERTTAHEGGRS